MTFRRPRKPFVRYNQSGRNYDDPLYTEFRSKVLARDKRTCQWPHCGSTKRLCVHHIKKWADYHSLRYDKLNGITLCKTCHDRIKDAEDYYILPLLRIAYENHKRHENDSTPPRRQSKAKDAGRKPKAKRPQKPSKGDGDSTTDKPI